MSLCTPQINNTNTLMFTHNTHKYTRVLIYLSLSLLPIIFDAEDKINFPQILSSAQKGSTNSLSIFARNADLNTHVIKAQGFVFFFHRLHICNAAFVCCVLVCAG